MSPSIEDIWPFDPSVEITKTGRWRYTLKPHCQCWEYPWRYAWGRESAEKKARAWVTAQWADRNRAANPSWEIR